MLHGGSNTTWENEPRAEDAPCTTDCPRFRRFLQQDPALKQQRVIRIVSRDIADFREYFDDPCAPCPT